MLINSELSHFIILYNLDNFCDFTPFAAVVSAVSLTVKCMYMNYGSLIEEVELFSFPFLYKI